jgi:hypothetical protein
LLEIDEEKQVYSIRLFQCLAFSRRPLRVEELAEVLAIQFGTAIPRLNTSLRPGDTDEAILSACSTLVTTIELDYFDENDDYDYDSGSDYNYDPDVDVDTDVNCDYDYDHNYNGNCSSRVKSRVVQFSHYSVKEFLTSNRLAKSDKGDISQYYVSPEPAHNLASAPYSNRIFTLETSETAFPLPIMQLKTGFTMLSVTVWRPGYRVGWSASLTQTEIILRCGSRYMI